MFYLLFFNKIPNGLVLDHLCKNRKCVNPLHLRVVTQAVNCLSGDSPPARNSRKTHCPNGHEYSPENTYHSGGRHCRICKKAQGAAFRLRKIKLTETIIPKGEQSEKCTKK